VVAATITSPRSSVCGSGAPARRAIQAPTIALAASGGISVATTRPRELQLPSASVYRPSRQAASAPRSSSSRCRRFSVSAGPASSWCTRAKTLPQPTPRSWRGSPTSTRPGTGRRTAIEIDREPKTLPNVPTEAEIRRYYQVVWQGRRTSDVVLIKTLLYTGVRVAELVAIRLDDVALDGCRIRITHGKSGKDRTVPFPPSFKETLALHIQARRRADGDHLFESTWKSPTAPAGYAPCSPATPLPPA